MSFWRAIFLGIVQGVTEFLPISSSGHLAILQNLFHFSVSGASQLLFDVMLHIGTLLAVLAAYRKDLSGALRSVPSALHLRSSGGPSAGAGSRAKLLLYLLIGSVPLVFAMLAKRFVEGLYDDMFFISAALFATGLILYFSDRYGGGSKRLREMTALDALLIGFAQMLAVVPGLSRSGVTIAAGLFCGLRRPFSVKFSFLLSVPAVVGAFLLMLPETIAAGIDWSIVPACLAGMLTAAVIGYFSIRLLDRVARIGTFGGFAYYCWGAGILTFCLSLIA